MKAGWHKCPLCGGARITKRVGQFSIETKDGTTTISPIEYYGCGDCGERFFEYEASKLIDEYCLTGRALKRR
jgi:YgiT-type zinc finger domain-containing protein